MVEREGFFPETNSIYVTSTWAARQGAMLVPGLRLGKVLGAGMQVRSSWDDEITSFRFLQQLGTKVLGARDL